MVREAIVNARLVLILVFVAAVSGALRGIQHQRIPVPERGTWITSDADSFYHMRRVQQAIRTGTIAGTDPALNFPEGSAIPWPPYYTAVATAATAPFLPEGEVAARDFVERRVASIPRWFGVATSVVAALAGWLIAGPAAALLAGLLHALSAASIVYSRLGNGDHHAWITLLSGGMGLLLSRALRPPPLRNVRAAALGGVGLGVVAGVALGSWVASVLYVLPVQIVLGFLVWQHGRTRLPGLAALGLAFHAAAIVALLPAVIASPWAASQPWMVVNLTWFHVAWLAVGGLVFVPLLRMSRPRSLQRYPWIVAGALTGLALLLLALNVGPAAGLRESFAWMARNDEFMGAVWESRGILGKGAAFDPFSILGHGLIVLPFAWAYLAWRAFRHRRYELLPWVVTAPLLFAQAARQVRFTDALALPMAVVLAAGAVALWKSRKLRVPRPAVVALLLAVAVAANVGTVRRTAASLQRTDDGPGQTEQPSAAVARELAEWCRTHTPADGKSAVLASWTWGHLIEWAAERPTVATNFGTFVGEESFRAPARFFLAEDEAQAEAILQERAARWVLLTTWLPNTYTHLIRTADPALRDRYIERGPEGAEVQLRFDWYRTMGARLLFEGRTLQPDGGYGPPLDFARVVHVSAARDARYRMRPEPAPAGWVWERVPGATVEATGAPGDVLELQVVVRYPLAQHEIVWTRSAVAGADGVARLRVPYGTDAANGDGQPVGPARWRMAGREGELVIPMDAVERGRAVSIAAG